MKLHVQPMTEQTARASATWQYEPPYDIYNFPSEAISLLLDTTNRYFAVHDRDGRLVGTCCFGAEARVMGGDYTPEEPDVLDVGVHMHPALVGRGDGAAAASCSTLVVAPLLLRLLETQVTRRVT